MALQLANMGHSHSAPFFCVHYGSILALFGHLERYLFDIRSCPLKGLLKAATATVTATAAARLLLLRLLSQAYYSHYHCCLASSCRTTKKISEFRAILGSRA